ncbi:MAG: FprA family A-type flavoprotein [Clostridiales bacterium]|nr:FprA family A-type flavoprotein [Clostridiales bacterium]
MKDTKITENIKYIGVDDKEIRLFEGQYDVPNGISYNSYLILDQAVVIMDTVDKRATDEWFNNLINELDGRYPDYLVISHLEPDHAYNIQKLANKYPNMRLIGNAKTFMYLPQFFEIPNLEERKIVVNEGDIISIGKHTLQFFMAPMVHWPEVMVTYEQSEKILFAADGFGKFGTLDTDEDWTCEARRYYFNIVGKYGPQVQALLKKTSTLDIKIICPLHGPILKDNLEYYIQKYDIWSKYEPEDDGVFIAYASIHGYTKETALKLAKILEEKGAKKVTTTDLTTDDMAEAIEDAFRYDKIILAASSYNNGLFPPMEQFLHHLESKNYQNRKIGIIENGTWAPSAARCMKDIINKMKDIIICNTTITIKSKMNEKNIEELNTLADEILNK